MHLDKSQPASINKSRPYQGVRVKDPVKELLRRKRSMDLLSTIPQTQELITHNNQTTFIQGTFRHDVASCSQEKSPVCDGEMAQWRASLPVTNPGIQPAITACSSPDYNQQATSTQPPTCLSSPALTADVYVQTLCPSYTMLTYTQTPLLTNIGTIPLAGPTCSLSQMEHQGLGRAYIPWTQPLTTLSTMLSGVQFAAGSTTFSGSSLVHMPMSKSLTTMVSQQDTLVIDSQPQILEPLQYSEQTIHKPHNEELDQDVELEASTLLDKILENQGKVGELGGTVSYSNSLFLSNAF
ncbi:POU domain class 2-associating factor 1 [Corythoichthys intestinalis]|uniref:POU domain class 2-associating factor 1 n=1 Tax=Corythoichthys intestinalis TaxID=161448 RepID=UPI0025A55607|nr:POU domain class 2-associating factor 1 [Corythoichthys intestinalis]